MLSPPSQNPPRYIKHWLQGPFLRSFPWFGLVCGERKVYFHKLMLLLVSDTRYKYNWIDKGACNTPTPDAVGEMALVCELKQWPQWRQARHFRWLCLKFLIFPEQVDAQRELLERRTQEGILVPALLHNLVHLKEGKKAWNTNTHFVLTNNKTGRALKGSFPSLEYADALFSTNC